MPSPLGHVLGAVAAGWLVSGAPSFKQVLRPEPPVHSTPNAPGPWWREAMLFGVLGALPDIDLLFGAHSGPTHSIGAAVLVGVVLGLARANHVLRIPPVATLTAAMAYSAAYGSHVLLDWLSSDTTAPIGIMALWPFRDGHYESDLHVFMAISRRYYQGWTFVRQNGIAAIRELAVLVPILILAALIHPRGGRGSLRSWQRAE